MNTIILGTQKENRYIIPNELSIYISTYTDKQSNKEIHAIYLECYNVKNTVSFFDSDGRIHNATKTDVTILGRYTSFDEAKDVMKALIDKIAYSLEANIVEV